MGGNTELGPRIRDNPCILHTVEINILIFSLGRYAHRAVLNSCRKNRIKKKKKTIKENEQAVAQTVGVDYLARTVREGM